MEAGAGTDVASLAIPDSGHNEVDDDIPAFIAQSNSFTEARTKDTPAQLVLSPYNSSEINKSNTQYGTDIPKQGHLVTPISAQTTQTLVRRGSPTSGVTPLQPLKTSVPLHGIPGAPGVLPPPRALAADPRLIAAARRDGAGAFAKAAPNIAAQGPSSSQAIPNDTWIKMMQNAKGTKPQGASGLANATIARAMAGYGAAGADLPLADIARAVRR